MARHLLRQRGMRNDLSCFTRNALARLDAHGVALLNSLFLARHVLQELVEVADLELVFDPGTDPDLLDALGVATLGAAQGALVGGGLGLVAGLLLGYPTEGLILGSLLAGVAGAERGVAAVRRGLRLRVRALSWAGQEYILVEAE